MKNLKSMLYDEQVHASMKPVIEAILNGTNRPEFAREWLHRIMTAVTLDLMEEPRPPKEKE